MEELLKEWIEALLTWLGVAAPKEGSLDHWIACMLVIAIAVAFDFLCRAIFVPTVHRIVRKTGFTWDDELLNPTVVRRICHVLSTLLLAIVLPTVFESGSEGYDLSRRLTQILFFIVVFRLVNALLRALYCIASGLPAWQNKPIKGLRQTAQGIAALVCGIMVLSTLLDKSPTILLTGLGASAAVVMLIFRDSILGFVSGIQLAANDMLQVGDWIAVPKYGADGRVEEVSLTTVKIRNWDNTIVTLPPYVLVSESFQNWRAMQLTGGRRVKRSVSIDMTSVRFCSAEMLDRYRRIDLIRDYVDQTQRRVEEYDAQHGIAPAETDRIGLHQTNLGIFRAYLQRYLEREVPVNKQMMVMVRQLQPTETGLPMELYFFTDTVDWIKYEGIQADVFDHVLAVIPQFDLRVFQNPSGNDLQALGPTAGLRAAASAPAE